jgi:hypothetical protein
MSGRGSKWVSFDILLIVVFDIPGAVFLLWLILHGRSDLLLYGGVFLIAYSGPPAYKSSNVMLPIFITTHQPCQT